MTINELYKVKTVSTNNKRHKIRVIAEINLYDYNDVTPYWKNSSVEEITVCQKVSNNIKMACIGLALIFWEIWY